MVLDEWWGPLHDTMPILFLCVCECDLFLFTQSLFTYSQVTDKNYMVFDEWWGPLKYTIHIHTTRVHLFIC